MKTKLLILLTTFFAAAPMIYASSKPIVESKETFIKITAGDKPEGAPTDRDAPLLLYIRKSSIMRISITDRLHSPGFDVPGFNVEIVTSGIAVGPNPDDHGVVVASAPKSYYYHFDDEPSAASFCEALLTDQKG
jgi:hypothetical protein